MENDLISRSALIDQLERLATHEDAWRQSCILGIVRTIDKAPAVDAVEVVRCKDCKHGIWDEDEGMFQCVEGADYDPEFAMYYGLICYEEADFFCKRGERRADE